MNTTMKRTKIMLTAAAVSATFAAAAGCYFLLPSGYISIDINPSIEIHTNRLNQVTSITGVNEDAQKLLGGYQLRDRDLEDVIEDMVDRMVLQGYLDQGDNANLLVTVDEGTVKSETLDHVNASIDSYLEYRSVSANVIGQSIKIDNDLRDRAAKQQISPGKMSVIDRLIAGDPTLRLEELSNTQVRDLLAYAKERDIPLDLLEDRLDDLEDRFDDDTTDLLEDDLDDLNDLENGSLDDLNDNKDDSLDNFGGNIDDDLDDDLDDNIDDDLDDNIDDDLDDNRDDDLDNSSDDDLDDNRDDDLDDSSDDDLDDNSNDDDLDDNRDDDFDDNSNDDDLDDNRDDDFDDNSNDDLDDSRDDDLDDDNDDDDE